MVPFRIFMLPLLTAASLRAQQVFINEIHYDNSGSDTGEGIEIAGPAGTALADYDVLLYNGNGAQQYGSLRLSGSIPNESSGAGTAWFPLQGIQNGDPDGMVLYHWPSATVVQRISYGGSFTASGGAAAGMVLPDIGVAESASTPPGQSLQLTGSGTDLSGFSWTGPRTASPGALNNGQVFSATPVRTTAMAVLPSLLREGDQAVLQIILAPPPVAPVTLALSVAQQGLLSLPATVTIPVSGTLAVPLTALTDDIADGFHEITLLAQPADPLWPVAGAGVQIVDADRPFLPVPGTLRLMSYNVRLGTGNPGTLEFNAAREVVERISPDVLIMQEVASTNVFADWLTLIQQAGFSADSSHIAITGDAYEGQPFVRGDISGSQDQSVVVVSRYPVKRRIQLGRGAAGRSEITRYPMLVELDVPWLDDAGDPVIVNVHLKAEAGDANNFRRALEAVRLREYLAAAGINPTVRNVIVAGDFNATDWQDQPVSYETNVAAVQMPGTGLFADGTALPLSFSAGPDLLSPGLTLPYRSFPHSGMNPAGLTSLPLFQADGTDARTFAFASYKLDYFFVSPPVTARGGAQTEIYNSRQEAVHDGLPKRRALPLPDLSTVASDHYAVFADIPLGAAQPALSVTFSREWVNEGDADLMATVSAVPPPAAGVLVNLSAWRDDRLRPIPATVFLSPASPSVTIPVSVPRRTGIEPHRRVALTASAPGCYSGNGSVLVRNLEASGLLVISQYHEPAATTSPRAVELLNVSGSAINFAVTPLQIRRYSNGGADGVVDAEATSGVLPPSAVLVIGDEMAGDYLVAQGIIPVPATPFASQLDHTVSLNASGHAAFLLDRLVYNGDDALEVLLDTTRCDVFGEIGHDPGTAWTGPGTEKTVDGTLTLLPAIATGSSGWRQPGTRFSWADTGLTGFGIAPGVTDPYFVWAAAAGISGMAAAPASDPDGDGAPNLLEYGLMTQPLLASSVPGLMVLPGRVSRRLRSSDASIAFLLESSSGLGTWGPAPGVDVLTENFGDGSVERTFTLAPSPSGRFFLRQRVSRP